MGSLADNPHDPGLNTATEQDQLVDMRLLSVLPSTVLTSGGQFNTSIIVSMSHSITLEIQASNQTWSLSAIYTSPIPDPDQIPSSWIMDANWRLHGPTTHCLQCLACVVVIGMCFVVLIQ
ncbi:hypothetical protein NC651_038322 [Populus alba x Populus x berolinensis]|nr:hypothetical protein NC651_038322 [Populus alba x Populus x berolinensis]